MLCCKVKNVTSHTWCLGVRENIINVTWEGRGSKISQMANECDMLFEWHIHVNASDI